MQKNVAFQFHADEAVQAIKDEQLSNHIVRQKARNAEAIRQNYPELYQKLMGYTLRKYSVFVNRNDERNILNFNDATTVYGLNARQQQLQHAQFFYDNRSRFWVARDKQAQPQTSNTLVILGVGLGDWLLPLLQQSNVKQLVLCEPEQDILFSSFITTDWVAILDYCAAHSIQLYLQVGEQCNNFKADISELLSATNESGFYLYRHLHYAQLDRFYQQLVVDKLSLAEAESTPDAFDHVMDQVPLFSLWREQVIDTKQPTADNTRFKKNLRALKRRYQDVYEQIKDYQPKQWELVRTQCGGVNLFHKQRHAFWYNESAQKDESVYLDQFEKNPSNVKPVMGSNGGMLSEYIHYQYVQKFVALRKSLGFKHMTLPDKLPSLMIFCPTLGLGVQSILKKRDVQSGFWVEPNIDFFYWSLHVMDWASVLDKVEDDESYLFLHIGDDGENLVDDLMERVNSTTGNYAINTYYYIPFLSANVRRSVAKLIESLTTLLSLSENFDHALFGISHTRKNLKNGVRILTQQERDECLPNGINVPLFIVGNGPSLDNDIEIIKQVRDKVLVMSCGTTLKALWANGIQPDFHAEVEQHKNSFNILRSLNDPEYLKGISFVGGSWAYPGTPKLFKTALTTLKDGEGTTQAIRKSVTSHQFITMKRSFPTVANLAIGFAAEMRFNDIYLFGLDLGFIDVNQHHSKHSIFYNNQSGGNLYEVKDQGWQISLVKGNFRPVVRTKFDFNLSLKMLEKTIATMTADIYNCSDGALIQGTTPLRSDLLLITSTADQATAARQTIEECVYADGNQATILEQIEANLDVEQIVRDIDEFIAILDQPFDSEAAVNKAFIMQKQLLIDKYHEGHQFFYSLMIATMSYVHAILTHFLYYGEDWDERKNGFEQAKDIALSMFRECRDDFAANPMRIDDTDWELIKKL